MLLGGLLTSYLNWSWIFFINVPVGIAAALLAPVLLRESRPDLGHRHFDVAGAATVTGGLMLLVYALTRGTTNGWGSAETLGLLGGAIALIGAFLVDRAALALAAAPAADLPLADTRDGATPRWRSSAQSRSRSSSCSTLYLQDVLHYSAVQSGVAFSGFALTVVVVSNLAQLIVGRVGVRATLTAGLLVVGGCRSRC